jgi:single-stranded-DNA-specific exonuclease
MLGEIERLAPFGPGNPEPTVALAEVRCDRARAIKGGHLRCDLTGSSGGRLKAVAWRADNGPLGRAIAAGGVLNVVGRLKADDWNGRAGVQLEVEDAADPRQRS